MRSLQSGRKFCDLYLWVRFSGGWIEPEARPLQETILSLRWNHNLSRQGGTVHGGLPSTELSYLSSGDDSFLDAFCSRTTATAQIKFPYGEVFIEDLVT